MHTSWSQDIIQPRDMDATFAEQEPERLKEKDKKDTSFAQSHIKCLPCVFRTSEASFQMNSGH